MRLAASQIGWEPGDEAEALAILRRHAFEGLEIAPTRAMDCPNPYDDLEKAALFAAGMRRQHSLAICSMQSIWYGCSGSIFGPERQDLLEYTKKAILFAEAVGCGNLVFGCPKNRVRPEGKTNADAVPFFRELGEFAARHGTVLAMEANPLIYGTNFINTTQQAVELVETVGCPAFRLNLDVGTMVENGEAVDTLKAAVPLANHVHVSEPMLVKVEQRALHRELAALLRSEGYGGFVSIEMKAQSLAEVENVAAYVAEVFA